MKRYSFSELAAADLVIDATYKADRATYYGDNRKPGYELHDRKSGRGGNQILRRAFELAHGGEAERQQVAPFLVFAKGDGRDAVFKGLAVPGAAHLDAASDLVAV